LSCILWSLPSPATLSIAYISLSNETCLELNSQRWLLLALWLWALLILLPRGPHLTRNRSRGWTARRLWERLYARLFIRLRKPTSNLGFRLPNLRSAASVSCPLRIRSLGRDSSPINSDRLVFSSFLVRTCITAYSNDFEVGSLTFHSDESFRSIFNNPPLPESEDCLYLNVFTPPSPPPAEGRPVMFWIHGGSFQLGSARLPDYDGSSLAVSQDVVVVTTNYRLNGESLQSV
jgi:hypothetical protein